MSHTRMYRINVYHLCFYRAAAPILELRINKTSIKRKEGQNRFFHYRLIIPHEINKHEGNQ